MISAEARMDIERVLRQKLEPLTFRMEPGFWTTPEGTQLAMRKTKAIVTYMRITGHLNCSVDVNFLDGFLAGGTYIRGVFSDELD